MTFYIFRPYANVNLKNDKILKTINVLRNLKLKCWSNNNHEKLHLHESDILCPPRKIDSKYHTISLFYSTKFSISVIT